MALPDRTLCWVEGPPWDRECQPVGSLLPSEETALDLTLLRARLGRLSPDELGDVIALAIVTVSQRTQLSPLGVAEALTARLREEES
jgi:hypothetical protein